LPLDKVQKKNGVNWSYLKVLTKISRRLNFMANQACTRYLTF